MQLRPQAVGIFPTAEYVRGMTTISGRVRTAMRSVAIQQKQLAEREGMTPDALSRALSGQRGFAAVELAAIDAEQIGRAACRERQELSVGRRWGSGRRA